MVGAEGHRLPNDGPAATDVTGERALNHAAEGELLEDRGGDDRGERPDRKRGPRDVGHARGHVIQLGCVACPRRHGGAGQGLSDDVRGNTSPEVARAPGEPEV